MNPSLQIKLCAYLMTLFGFWSVTMTDYFLPLWSVGAVVLVVVGWFFEGPRRGATTYRRIWMTLSICMLAFLPFDLIISRSLLLPAIHVSMFVQAYLLFNPKNITAYRRITIVSFAMLLASTILSPGVAFAVILTAYCVVAVYAIILMQLLDGIENSYENGSALTKLRPIPTYLFGSSLFWTLALIPLTLAFFFVAPRLRYAIIAGGSNVEALSQMTRARQRTGFTKTVRLGSFGPIMEDQTLALRIEVPDNPEMAEKLVRWRGGALNIYDGMVWSSSRDFFAFYTGKQWRQGSKNQGTVYPRNGDLFIMDEDYSRYSWPVQLDRDNRLVKQVCYLEIPYSDSIFGAGSIKAARGPFRYGIGLDFNTSFYIKERQALPEFISYTVYSELHEPNTPALKRVSIEDLDRFLQNEDYGKYVRAHFLQVPTSLDPRIKELALDVTKDAATPYEKVEALEFFLETQYTYSLSVEGSIIEDPLSDFLFVSRTGHCEYFATAMTLMARSIGLPARLVKGFQKGEWNEEERFFDVRQSDAHAWIEVLFPGYGWIEFDPSPRASADEYFESQRSPLARALSKRLLLLKIGWRKQVIGYNQSHRAQTLRAARNFLFRAGPKAVVSFFKKFVANLQDLLIIYAIPTLLLALLMVAAYVAHRLKILRLPAIPSPFARFKRVRNGTAFYERMLALLEKRKIVKPDHITPLEFLEAPILRAHPMISDIEALTSIYYRVRFGGGTLGYEESTTVNGVLKRLKQENGRARAPVS